MFLALSSPLGCSRFPLGSRSLIRTGHKQGHLQGTLRLQQGLASRAWGPPTPEGQPMSWTVNCRPQGRGERPPILTGKMEKDKRQQTIQAISFWPWRWGEGSSVSSISKGGRAWCVYMSHRRILVETAPPCWATHRKPSHPTASETGDVGVMLSDRSSAEA